MANTDWSVSAANYFVPTVWRVNLAFVEHTISAGSVALAASLVELAAETGTADDLNTLTGGQAGQYIVVRAKAGHSITLKHATSSGAFEMNSGADVVITDASLMRFMYDGVTWREFDKPSDAGGSTPAAASWVGAQAERTSSTQTVAAGNTDAVALPTTVEESDTSWHSSVTNNSRITVQQETGQYHITATLEFGTYGSTPAGNGMGLLIKVNGTTFIENIYKEGSFNSFSNNKLQISIDYYLEIGDYVEMYVDNLFTSDNVVVQSGTKLHVHFVGA